MFIIYIKIQYYKFLQTFFNVVILTYKCYFRPQSAVDRIFNIIRELAGGSKVVKLSEFKEACANIGFQVGQVEDCLDEYEQLNVWQVNQARTTITFV